MGISSEGALRIEKEIKNIWDNPGEIVGNYEKTRFEEYCNRWKNGGSIDDLFQETDRVYFPIFHSSGISKKLDMLIDCDRYDDYIRILGDCPIPFLISEMLQYKLLGAEDDKFILKILGSASVCISVENDGSDERYLFDNHIDSYLAPVALNILAEDALRNYKEGSGKKDQEKNIVLDEAVEAWMRIVDVLEKRKDGLYLSYHYVKKLLSIYRNVEYVDNVANVISDGYKKRESIEVDIWRKRYLSSNQDDNYAVTGILRSPTSDVLLEYRTLLRFLPDETVGEAFKIWIEVFSYDAQSFFTNGITRDLKHYEISELIYAQDDVIDSWKEVRNVLAGAYHRIGCDYYQDGSLSNRSHIEFLWNVNICLLAYLKDSDELDEAMALWQMIWEDGLQYIRRYAHYMDASPYQYVAALITTYFCLFVRDDSEDGDAESIVDEAEGTAAEDRTRSCRYLGQLLHLFEDIDEMPILVLQSIDMLHRNKIDLNVFLSDEDYFLPIVRRAGNLAFGRKEYEWVGKWIKEHGVKL